LNGIRAVGAAIASNINSYRAAVFLDGEICGAELQGRLDFKRADVCAIAAGSVAHRRIIDRSGLHALISGQCAA